MDRKEAMLRRALLNDAEIMRALITVLVKLGDDFPESATIQLLNDAVHKTCDEL